MASLNLCVAFHLVLAVIYAIPDHWGVVVSLKTVFSFGIALVDLLCFLGFIALLFGIYCILNHMPYFRFSAKHIAVLPL